MLFIQSEFDPIDYTTTPMKKIVKKSQFFFLENVMSITVFHNKMVLFLLNTIDCYSEFNLIYKESH